jgi:hypothetical protein
MMVQSILKIEIHEAKSLKELVVPFKKEGLTAILGPNGSGKSTILHLLACGYNTTDQNGTDFRYPSFFLPVSYPDKSQYSWEGTSFTYYYYLDQEERPLKVSKLTSRWMRYYKRPERWVSYIGIETCVPDIEKEKLKSHISYISLSQMSPSILDDAKYILGKNYAECQVCRRRDKRTNKRVKVGSTLYSSLSMGAGEQRVFTILEAVDKAEAYGLILIDELDLLLHQSSLKRLIEKLASRAEKKHLQIIFTVHNQFILTCPEVDFRHILHKQDKCYCLAGNDPQALEQLTDEVQQDIMIYVEDELSKALVRQICSEERCMKRVTVSTFGAIENAFALAVSCVLIEELRQKKMIFVLDGDKYRTDDERLKQLKKHLTGQGNEQDNHRRHLLTKIKQFEISGKPEEYYFNLIKKLPEQGLNISSIAESLLEELRSFNPVGLDSHSYFSIPIEKLGMSKPDGYGIIAELLSKTDQWDEIVVEVRKWIKEQLS